MQASSPTLDELPDTTFKGILWYLSDVAPRAPALSSPLYSRPKCAAACLHLSRPFLARIPHIALGAIFLYSGEVAPRDLAFSGLIFTRFKASGQLVRRTRLLCADFSGVAVTPVHARAMFACKRKCYE